jgi:hypothetical protein
MVGIDGKAVAGLQGTGEGRQEGVGRLGHISAHLAHEMEMAHRRYVVDGRAVPEMRVADDTQILELVEKAVDRRHVHIKSVGLDVSRKILR